MGNDLVEEPETGSFRERLNSLPTAAKALIIIGVIVLLAVIFNIDGGGSSGGSGSGSGSSSGYQAEYGGEASVYSRIAGLTNCGALQAEFDTASANHDRTGDLWTTGYMVAVGDRMETLGCP